MRQQAELDTQAARVFELLRMNDQILVTAESCTAGLISATLARVPGISKCLAGSFVVYQIDSKVAWLDVLPDLITEYDVVSSKVAESMAVNALRKTPHATMAISMTGHLGPDATEGLDGIAWLGFVSRLSGVRTVRLQLRPESAAVFLPEQHLFIRHERQRDAVCQSLVFLCDRLAEMSHVRSTAP